jgi:hypothetical protein
MGKRSFLPIYQAHVAAERHRARHSENRTTLYLRSLYPAKEQKITKRVGKKGLN